MNRSSLAFLICMGAAGTCNAMEIPRAVWMTYARTEPTHVTIHWLTPHPMPSVITTERGETYRGDAPTMRHQVEVPLPLKAYRIGDGQSVTEPIPFFGVPEDELRVICVANWGYAAVTEESVDRWIALRPHLLLTAGDNVPALHGDGIVGEAARINVKPFEAWVMRYPTLFRSVPVMPSLGNHDREIRPRGTPQTRKSAVYDPGAFAYGSFFSLPDKTWCWRFDFAAYGARFVSVDLNHVQDLNTLLQTCHNWQEGSESLTWYQQTMEQGKMPFVVTLNNEKCSVFRDLAKGAWFRAAQKGALVIAGFGYFGEWSGQEGAWFCNTSLKGTGDVYRDPQSKLLVQADNFVLLRYARDARALKLEMRRLDDGLVLFEQRIDPR